MKNMLIIFAICLISLTISAEQSLAAKSPSIELSIDNYLELSKKLREIQKGRLKNLDGAKLTVPHKIESMNRLLTLNNKVFNFVNNLASALEEHMAKGNRLSGHQILLMQEGLSAFIHTSNDNLTFIKNLKDGKITLQSLIWANTYAQTQERFKITYDIYFAQKSLRFIIRDQLKEKDSSSIIAKNLRLKIFHSKELKALEMILNKLRVQKINRWNEQKKELVRQISGTLAYQYNKKGIPFRTKFTAKSYLADGMMSMLSNLTKGISFGFGKVAGNIKWRNGHMNKNKNAYKHLTETLRPFDMILEKRGFLFTDYTIPGHWGHIGVYLGTEKQLKEEGLWNHPSILPFQDKIRQGHSIYEVRRWGLVFQKLDTWLNIDELAVIRVKSLDKAPDQLKYEMMENLLSQYGKKYDYNFDAMTTSTVTCSEIITFSYGPIHWPSDFTLGRMVITPNNMAELALFENSPIEFVTYLKATNKGLSRLGIKDYAKVINYVPRREGERILFDEKGEKCRAKFIRKKRNRIVIDNKCVDTFTHHEYLY